MTYKFRGKRIDNKTWVYGAYFEWDDKSFIVQKDIWDIPSMALMAHLIEVDPSTVGMFTGLTDKNGKESYKGDVVKQVFHKEEPIKYYEDSDFNEYDGYYIGSVTIIPSKGACMKNPFQRLTVNGELEHEGISRQYKGIVSYRCEIIGNIHDNPELLKEDGE